MRIYSLSLPDEEKHFSVSRFFSLYLKTLDRGREVYCFLGSQQGNETADTDLISISNIVLLAEAMEL